MTSRTWLFVPGHVPDRFAKAAASGADEVILDLEDTVNPAAEVKVEARDAVTAWLRGAGRAWVRINAPATSWGEADLAGLVGVPGLAGVVVPKAEEPDEIERVGDLLGVPVVPLVETARGVTRSRDIASARGVAVLAFGSIDFVLDVGAAQDAPLVDHARCELVLASRSSGLVAPVDGVTSAVRDLEAVRRDATHAKALGFGGKLCIHPAQLEAVVSAFAPTEDEIDWARGVLDAVGGESLAVGPDGSMIDRPVIERARRILETDEEDLP